MFEELTWKNNLFYQNGEPSLMISGEFHYFRVPKKDWRDRLIKWKEAGGTAIATYIPWLIHEPEEGLFSFSQHDYDDLEGFLQVCREENIQVIARPGPYQYSELKYCGLPAWLGEKYPEILARDIDGKIFSRDSVSYMHPLFLQKAEIYIRKVCHILAKWCADKGGPVTAVQIDNESMGIHVWFNHGWYDYNAETFGFNDPKGRWPQFLQNKHVTVKHLSEAWETPIKNFSGALPICKKASSSGDVRRLRDYEQCYFRQIADYFMLIRKWMTESGITVPFVHNSPNPEANASFLKIAEAMGDRFLLGSDHYYTLNQNWAQNNPTPQYAVRNFISLELLRNMGMPPTVWEMPSGSASDWPPILPQDAGAAYLTNLAMGMKGWNYYIYTGGPNVPGTGSTTDLYDYNAPVSAAGECRPLYYEQKRIHQLCKKFDLAQSRLLSDFTVGYAHEMLLGWPWDGLEGENFLSPKKTWNYAQTGIITTAFCSGITPQLCDLNKAVPDPSKVLSVVTGTVLAREAQENIAEFLRQGGKLIMGPVLPILDEEMNPCSILAEAAGIRPCMLKEENEKSILDFMDIPNIQCDLYTSIEKEGQTVLGTLRDNGRVVSSLFPAGKGRVLWNGFAWVHGRTEQNLAFEKMLHILGCIPAILKSEKNLFVTVHQCPEGPVVFAMNLYSSPIESKVTFKNHMTKYFSLAPMEVRIEKIE